MFVNHILQVPNFYLFFDSAAGNEESCQHPLQLSQHPGCTLPVCLRVSTHPPDCNAKLPREKEAFTSALPG